MPSASEYEAARRARCSMHDAAEVCRKLRALRGSARGAERELLDALRDALERACEALGLDVALSMPTPGVCDAPAAGSEPCGGEKSDGMGEWPAGPSAEPLTASERPASAMESLCREMAGCLCRTASSSFWWCREHGLGVEEMDHGALGPRALKDIEGRIGEARLADAESLERTLLGAVRVARRGRRHGEE